MTSLSRSIPATLPPTVRTDLVARVARYAVPFLASIAGTVWVLSQRTAGYDRAAAMTAENRQWIFDHEKTLAEHDSKIAVLESGIEQIRADMANMRGDVHEIRVYVLRTNGAKP